MNLLVILISAVAIIVTIVFLALISAIIAALLFCIAPALERTWMAANIFVLPNLDRLWQMFTPPAEIPHPGHVCLCRNPLRAPEYLLRFAGGEWTWEKRAAMQVPASDTLALQKLIAHLEDREQRLVFVVYPPMTKEGK